MPVGASRAEDRLDVHLLAELVDAAVAEHRAAQQRIGVLEDRTAMPNSHGSMPSFQSLPT